MLAAQGDELRRGDETGGADVPGLAVGVRVVLDRLDDGEGQVMDVGNAHGCSPVGWPSLAGVVGVRV